MPVLVWYSPEMYEWLKTNRPDHGAAPEAQSVPDGALIIKEMYTSPAAACTSIPWERLRPTAQGAAVMVRDSQASQDGWFWGWFGWTGWQPDWPARANSPYPNMGFGQYCTNCHASAADNQTFSALKNIKGEPGEPLVFLSQELLPRSVVAEPARQHPAGGHAAASQRAGFQRRLHQDLLDLGRPAGPRHHRRDAPGDLRQRLGQGRPADHRQPVRHVGPMPRLPQRGRHRPAVRHDAAGHRRQAHQHLALRHLARLAHGARGPRSDLLRPARERDADVPPDRLAHGAGHLPRLSRHPRPAPVRDRPPRRDRQMRRIPAHDRGGRALSARPSDRQARQLRRARARRHLVHGVPSHGARQRRYGEIPRRAAEHVRAGAPGVAQSRPDRVRRDLHRQLPRRAARPVLRAVPGPQEEADEARDRQRSRAQCECIELRAVRLLPHGASAGPASRADDRPHLRADDLSGMGVQRLSHRDHARRAAAARRRRAGPVLPSLPHAEQGRAGQSVPQQDRGDPGIHQLPAGREHAAARRHRPAGALGLRQAHAGRPQRLPAQDGVAVPRDSRHPPRRPDAEQAGHRFDPDRRERDARPGGEPHRQRQRRRREDRRRCAERAREHHQQGRPQVPVRRRLPPRLRRVQRARRQQQGAVVLGPHQRRRRHRRRQGRADRRRAVVEGGLLGAHRSRGAHPPAALSGHRAARTRRRSTRSFCRRRPTSARRSADRARSPPARSPRASCRSAPR